MKKQGLLPMLFLALTIVSCQQQKSMIGKTEVTTWFHNKSAALSITYDDATINQFKRALPIMDSLNMKGTFFINTADIPGSEFRPQFIGRPLAEIIKETASVATNDTNLFERGAAMRFLKIENAVERHNEAGAIYEKGERDKAKAIIDNAFAEARKRNAYTSITPKLLEGEIITWQEIQTFAANGHEFGNHTISHPRLAILDEPNLLYELEKCKGEIQSHLGTRHTFSAECPFGTEDERVMQYAYKIHPALRNRMPEGFLEELNRWSTKTPGQSSKQYVQWQRGPLQKNGIDEMKSWVDTIANHSNVWLVLTFHGVDGIGWEAKPHEELSKYFHYINDHDSTIWTDTFGNVTRYMREAVSAAVESTKTPTGLDVTVRHTLDSVLYDFPLTVKTYVDRDWKSVSFNQGARSETLTPRTDANGPYVLYDAIPNKETIRLAKAE